MLHDCQPIIVNSLYGSLTIHTLDSSSCLKPRQWYFFYDYGYTLFIHFISITQLISNSFIFKIYSVINKQQTLVYDSTNVTIVNKEILIDVNKINSGVLFELISIDRKTIQPTSFMIDYAFRTHSQGRFGRQLLQDNSSSSSFNPAQPSFIVLICVIILLVIAIIIATSILCYRHYRHRKHSRKRSRNHHKFREGLDTQQSTDQLHLATSVTPSSVSSYSVQSSRYLCAERQPTIQIQQPISSLGQSLSTLPSMVPSRRLQQSIMDAYLNDFESIQPATIDANKLNPYLFIDLHSTSSETYPDATLKSHPTDNTTTSGYDTSTCGEEGNYKNSQRNYRSRRRRRRHYIQSQRQRRRSTLAFKRRSNAPRFLMRERSLPPGTHLKLPQLRQQLHLFNIRDLNNSSTTSNTNQDHISTNISTTTDDYDDSHAYHVNSTRIMNTIEEEKPSMVHKSSPTRQPCVFEMVSTYCGDDSDMPNYEQLPRRIQSSSTLGNGIAYVNDSILV